MRRTLPVYHSPMAGTVKKGAGLVLLFGMFQVVLGSTVSSGLYAIYEREWDLTRIQTTLVFAAYVAGVLFSLIFLGGLADRFGRKPAILFSVCSIMRHRQSGSHNRE